MATSTAAGGTGAERESRQHERSGGSQIVIVDLDKPQPAQLIKRLRKGRGKLVARVEKVVADLAAAGTIKATAQPVVLVVRELPSMPWPLSAVAEAVAGKHDDDDDDDED